MTTKGAFDVAGGNRGGRRLTIEQTHRDNGNRHVAPPHLQLIPSSLLAAMALLQVAEH